MKIAIIGMGEIGKALFQTLMKKCSATGESFKIICKDKDAVEVEQVDYLHICYPYSWEFTDITNNYISLFKPKLTLVHTTTVVGATNKLNGLKVHCPIRGRHANLSEGIAKYPLFIGYDKPIELELSMDYCDLWACRPTPSFPSESTELAKLLSLTQYGYNIEFWRYAKRCCDEFNVDPDRIQQYTQTYNDVIKGIDGDNFCKTILDPTDKPIGGHCVLPAMEKINEQVPNKSIAAFLETNKELSFISEKSNNE